MINKINRYLIKSFLKNFLIVALGFSAMFFLINILDIFERIKDSEVDLILVFGLAILKIPQSLTSIISSVVLISAILTFYQLSIRSEITIIRNCGYSIWKILTPVASCAVVLGIFWITIFNLIEIWSSKKFYQIENEYIEMNEEDLNKKVENANTININYKNSGFFKKGQIPWNKSIKMSEEYKENWRSKNTSIFIKGQIPWNKGLKNK